MKEIWQKIEQIKDKNGSISSKKLEEILSAHLDSVKVPENFDLIEELAKDLKYLHPRRR